MALRKKPDGLLILIGLIALSVGIGTIFGSGFGWLATGVSFVIASFISGI